MTTVKRQINFELRTPITVMQAFEKILPLFSKLNRPVFLTAFIFLLLQNTICVSQPANQISGKIINTKTGKPIAFATVASNKKKRKTMADATGNFILSLNGINKDDSLFISSVGYKKLMLTIHDAVSKDVFALNEETKEMQPVFLYSKEEDIGSKSRITAYFRSWNHHSTGGEKGKIFNVGHSNFKLERVRFKVNNRCDTCLVRLHIREIVNGLPGDEILYDSISTYINKLTIDDKFSEFDLRNRDLIFKNKWIYVGFEILNCSEHTGEPCSMCYIGTEAGDYLYKNRKYSDWEEASDYSIYMRLFYKY